MILHAARVAAGMNAIIGLDDRLFTFLRAKGEIVGLCLKCRLHEEAGCLRGLWFGTLNPMSPAEAQARLLRWERAGEDLAGLDLRQRHKVLGAAPLLRNLATAIVGELPA